MACRRPAPPQRALALSEVEVPQDYRGFIIGKEGQNLKKLKGDLDVDIIVPNPDEKYTSFLLAGEEKAVQQLQAKLVEAVKELANSTTEKFTVEPKLHRWIVGQKGVNIKRLSEKYERVHVHVPAADEKSDVITVRGPKSDVEAVRKEVLALIEEAKRLEELNGHMAELSIDHQFVKYIVGKEGAAIKKLSAAHNIQIDIEQAQQQQTAGAAAKPAEEKPAAKGGKAKAAGGAASVKDKIVLRGTKEGIDAAKKELQQRIKELTEAGPPTRIEFSVDRKYHGALIGPKGQWVNSLRDRYGVEIKFPGADSDSDVIVIMGSEKLAAKAKAELLELYEDELAQNSTTTIPVADKDKEALLNADGKRESLKVRDICAATSTRPKVVKEEGGAVSLQLRGNPNSLADAEKQIKAYLKEFASRVSEEVPIERKYYKTLIGPGGSRLQELFAKHGQMVIRFSDADSGKDVVLLQGTAAQVAGAKADLLASVAALAKKQEGQFRAEVAVPAAAAPLISTAARALQAKYKVAVSVAPAAADAATATASLLGKEADVQALAEVLKAGDFVRAEVPGPEAGKRTGLNGNRARQISDAHGVSLTLPPQNSGGPVVLVGPSAAVAAASAAVEAAINGAPAGGAANGRGGAGGASESLQVETELHPAIIGAGGATINRIRAESGARIDLQRGSDIVELRGTPEQIATAKRLILEIVDERRSVRTATVRVDPSFYGLIIGPRGSTLHQLESDHNVRINVPSAAGGRGRARGRGGARGGSDIVIRGSEDGVEAAKAAILEIVEQEVRGRPAGAGGRRRAHSGANGPRDPGVGEGGCRGVACGGQRQRRLAEDDEAPADEGEVAAADEAEEADEPEPPTDTAFFAAPPPTNAPKVVWGKSA